MKQWEVLTLCLTLNEESTKKSKQPYYPGNQLCTVEGRPIRFRLEALYTVSVSCTYPWGFTYAAIGPHKDKLQTNNVENKTKEK